MKRLIVNKIIKEFDYFVAYEICYAGARWIYGALQRPNGRHAQMLFRKWLWHGRFGVCTEKVHAMGTSKLIIYFLKNQIFHLNFLFND